MKDNDDEKIIKELKEGLDYIDTKIPIATPDIARFRRMVAKVEEDKERKTKKETIIFIAIAAIIIGGETYAFNQSFLFFIVIQGAAFTSFIIGILNWFFRIRKKVETI